MNQISAMSEADNSDDRRTEWAEDRTDWAEDRTVLANERTFAGWMRTGMASIALAVGLKAVFKAAEPTWIAQSVATIFLAAAILIFWSARTQACRTQDRLSQNDCEMQPTRNYTTLAVVFTVATVAVAGILWSL